MRGDVGVKDGRIVAVGEVDEDARETIDATGRIVAPGFIDVHTHYDAQVFWDPTLSPSCFHGVTTVFGGFCGFSIAPMTPEAADYIMPMLARVEGMPLETLQSARAVELAAASANISTGFEGKIGLNAGFFAGHSAIRRVVMGERAVGEKCDAGRAREDEGAARQVARAGRARLLDDDLADRTTTATAIPSRRAGPTTSEIVELAGVVRDHEGTGLELLPDIDFGPGVPELITELSIAGNRPVNWNALAIIGRPNDAASAAKRSSRSATIARERGGEVIALTVPCTPDAYVNLRSRLRVRCQSRHVARDVQMAGRPSGSSG